jgi:hypothetical protein
VWGGSVGPWTSCGDVHGILLQLASSRADAQHGSICQISDSCSIHHMPLVCSNLCGDVSDLFYSCIITMSVPHCLERLSMPALMRLSYTLTE